MAAGIYDFAASVTPWQLFVTPTLRGARWTNSDGSPSARVTRCMLFQFLRIVADEFDIPFRDEFWLAREELGEIGGRFHWHLLLSGLHGMAGRRVIPSPNPVADVHRVIACWQRCGASAGIIDVRPYDARLSGVSYIMKGLEDWSTTGANAYELSKYDDSQVGRQLIASRAWLRWYDTRSSKSRRHRKAVTRRATGADRSATSRSDGPGYNPDRMRHFADDPTVRLYC